MSDPLFWHRVQFGFTIAYHYLFPQLTMGLALLIVVLKIQAVRTGEARWGDAARFWVRVFGLLVFGEKRLGPKRHLAAAVALFAGSWLSGYFIVTTNAFMQNPVGYSTAPDGTL